MTNLILRQALACADRGWPIFPCQPGQKTPATPHGYLDATTDPAQISEWFARHPERNLAVATGTPGPDVLDVDHHGPAGNGYAALAQLRAAGLLDGIAASTRTPSGGLHLYLLGSRQRCGHLPARHLDFLAQGGYALVPPSRTDGRPYYQMTTLGGDSSLDWTAAVRVLEPSREHPPRRPRLQAAGAAVPEQRMRTLTRWLASRREGNRNNGLFWAANRALEADPAADLSPLAAAARQTGLDDIEITRTLSSARRRTTQSQPHPRPADRDPEGTS